MKRKTRRTLLLLAVVLALPATKGGAKPGRKPRYVTYHISGAHLQQSGEILQHDPKTGYYLLRWRGCCGGPMGVVLSPHKQQVAELACLPDEETARGSLPSRTTGSGVAIGDSPERVRQLLGMPTRSDPMARQPKRRVYTYIHRFRDGESLKEYRAVYTFRKERLRAIEFMEVYLEGG